jgi:hypothetical protein
MTSKLFQEWYACDCTCHKPEPVATPARWDYRYGPEARQALCTDCMLTRLTEHDDVVPEWKHELRKLRREGYPLKPAQATGGNVGI